MSRHDVSGGHLSTTLYNEQDPGDVYIIQYELDMVAADRLFGQADTNHGVSISIAWDRVEP